MSKTALLFLCTLALPGGQKLGTDYAGGEVRRIEVRTLLELETAMTSSGGGQGTMTSSSEIELEEVAVDRVVEHAGGRPGKVERTFEKVAGKTHVQFGDRDRETDLESPFQDLVLEITREGDEAPEVKVKKGSEPAGENALAHHVPELFLDGLLPAGEVEADATWTIDSAEVRRALRLDVQPAMYRPAPAAEGAEGGRGRRGGRMGGERMLGALGGLEWKGKAKLVGIEGDGDLAVARIELEFEAKGDLPEPERGPRGEGRLFGPGAPVRESSATVRLEGTLEYSLAKKRPSKLELEGPVQIEATNEFERQGETMRIETKSEGTLRVEVEVTPGTE